MVAGPKADLRGHVSVASGSVFDQSESNPRMGISMVIRKARLFGVVVALPFLAAIAGAQGARPACAAQAPTLPSFDSTKAGKLVGAFDVVMVDTTSLRGSVRQHSGKLTLWLTDSVPKRRASMARHVQHQFLVGIFEVAAPDSGEMWTHMVSRSIEAPGAFWSDGFLRLGEFGPKSGISLYAKLISDDEIRGMWTSHAGTGVVIDFTGEREPDEAGYFCARRVK